MKKETEEAVELSVKAEIFDWLQSIVFAIIACVLLFMFVARVVTVDGSSMNPTLLHGDRLIVSNLSKNYEQGDVVVFVAPEYMDEPLVKRVIATGGQLVEINFDKGIVKVDEQELYEPYIAELTADAQDYDGPIEVPEGHVFVMGDNRNRSTDSRTDEIGCVDTRYILGKAYFVMFPMKSFGGVQTEFEPPVETGTDEVTE
ncbi:MAG: signal peptidase I [Oscillospiraceae bacterium]|nr:signal peptidase I [Oscillospiraceae bacterium]